jgi:hypothetical protein
MSKVSDIYDQLANVVIPSLLPSHTRFANAYSLEDNIEGLMRQGWGFRVGPSTPFESDFKSFNNVRTFSIIVCREVVELESQFDTLDSVSKNLLEDIYILQKDLLNVDQIEIESSIEQIEAGGVTGIEFVQGEKFNFAFLEAEFLINIRENL